MSEFSCQAQHLVAFYVSLFVAGANRWGTLRMAARAKSFTLQPNLLLGVDKGLGSAAASVLGCQDGIILDSVFNHGRIMLDPPDVQHTFSNFC